MQICLAQSARPRIGIAYKTHSEVQRFVKYLPALALIPINKVPEVFDN